MSIFEERIFEESLFLKDNIFEKMLCSKRQILFSTLKKFTLISSPLYKP